MNNLDINIVHWVIGRLIELAGQIPLPLVGVGGGIEAKETVDIVSTVKFTLVFIAGVGAIFGFGLAFAAKKFSVKMDPRIDKVREVLAGAQCGACGFAGCQQYAEAVVADGSVKATLCVPAGKHAADVIAAITGKKAVAMEPLYSRILCQGDCKKSTRKFTYEGVRDCRAAVQASGGDKTCAMGCLGFGTCVAVCPFDALHMNEFNLPVVDIKKCTGCRKCAEACPKNVIEILPASKGVLVACHSKDTGAVTRKCCQIGCIACGMCVKVCPFEAPFINNNVSRINIDKCHECGLCVTKCPTHAIIDLLQPRGKAFITDSKCIGCNMCMKVCPVNAASGELKKPHTIDQSRCIGCGICVEKCPKQAIDGTFNAEEVFEKAALKKQSA